MFIYLLNMLVFIISSLLAAVYVPFFKRKRTCLDLITDFVYFHRYHIGHWCCCCRIYFLCCATWIWVINCWKGSVFCLLHFGIRLSFLYAGFWLSVGPFHLHFAVSVFLKLCYEELLVTLNYYQVLAFSYNGLKQRIPSICFMNLNPLFT